MKLEPITDPNSNRVLLLRPAQTAAPDPFPGAESDVGLDLRGFSLNKIIFLNIE